MNSRKRLWKQSELNSKGIDSEWLRKGDYEFAKKKWIRSEFVKLIVNSKRISETDGEFIANWTQRELLVSSRKKSELKVTSRIKFEGNG